MQLIPKTPDLLNKLYEWSLDPEMQKYLGFPSVPMDYINLTNYFDKKYDGRIHSLIGVVGDSGDIHGCYLIECNEKDRRAKVDFAFDEVGRGKLLQQSVIAFYDYMFNERYFLTLWGEISVNNEASYNCAMKMGWEDVGLLPEYFNEMGNMVDAHLIRLTREMREI